MQLMCVYFKKESVNVDGRGVKKRCENKFIVSHLQNRQSWSISYRSDWCFYNRVYPDTSPGKSHLLI